MKKLIAKDLKIFFSDRRGMLLTFLLPMILITLFGFMFGVNQKEEEAKPMELCVADADQSPASKAIIKRLDSLPELEVYTTTPDSAIQLIKKGDEAAALVFHKGLSDSLQKGVRPFIEMQYDAAKEMELGILQSALMAKLMQILGNAAVENQVMKSFEEKNASMDPQLKEGIRLQIREQFHPATSKTEKEVPVIKATPVISQEKNSPMLIQVVAGNAITMLLFSVVGIGSSLLEEKQEGTLKKLISTPIPAHQILLSKMVYANILCAIQLLVLFVYARLLFGLDVEHHIPSLLLMLVVTAFACSGFGVMLASVARSKSQVQGFSTLIVLSMSAIGGSMIPSFIMPELLQKASHFTVNYWGIQGFYDIFWRKLPIQNSDFLLKVGVLFLIGLGLNLLAVKGFRKHLQQIA
ncbi:MAG TPA: ABC transporter permease [Chitinophagaceae bacterium]|nr:ABC transporter permease [Chitinophagaceae bacterium]